MRNEPGSFVDAVYRGVFIVGYRVARLWWFVRRPVQHGAYVALWCEDELLMIRNSYKKGDTVPCGGIAPGESPLQAAQRELFEEVGVRVSQEQLVAITEFPFESEYKRDHAHFYELRLETRPELRVDRREVVAASFVPRSELAGRPLVPALRRYLERHHSMERVRGVKLS